MDETRLRARKCRSDKKVAELSRKSGEGRQTGLISWQSKFVAGRRKGPEKVDQ
jgi:hypothetical protein